MSHTIAFFEGNGVVVIVLGKVEMAWGLCDVPQASFYIVCLGSHLNPKHHRIYRFDEGEHDRKYFFSYFEFNCVRLKEIYSKIFSIFVN